MIEARRRPPRQYDVDPLEVLLADEVMHPAPAVLTVTDLLPPPAPLLLATVPRLRTPHGAPVGEPLQRLFPVLDGNGHLAGVAPARPSCTAVTRARASTRSSCVIRWSSMPTTLCTVASRFAAHGVTAAPVVDRHHPETLLGLITADHLLDGRLRDLAEEHHRERIITAPRWPRRRAGRRSSQKISTDPRAASPTVPNDHVG
ncbi:MAG: chloride channel protein family [Pseudonocardiales bacterium]|nr:chloride channel protein family [Pseudonocardiales bacterium]